MGLAVGSESFRSGEVRVMLQMSAASILCERKRQAAKCQLFIKSDTGHEACNCNGPITMYSPRSKILDLLRWEIEYLNDAVVLPSIILDRQTLPCSEHCLALSV